MKVGSLELQNIISKIKKIYLMRLAADKKLGKRKSGKNEV